MNHPEQNHSEREPEIPQESFVNLTRMLDSGDSLVLFRNRVQHIRGGEVWDKTPVHYESLNFLSDIYRPLHPGALVADEFEAAAAEMAKGHDETPWVTYPLLTVINHKNGTRITETINIPRLIEEKRLPLYSLKAQIKQQDEMITAGFDTLIKDLAQKVGINPIGAVVIKNDGAYTIEEMGLSISAHISKDAEAGAEEGEREDDVVSFDPRGVAALSLLQMKTSENFAQSQNRVLEGASGRIEVEVQLGTQPDLQTLMLSLIDLIEENDMHLAYSYDTIATEEIGSVFSVVDEKFNYKLPLSGEQTIDMAVYNAYLEARRMLTERS